MVSRRNRFSHASVRSTTQRCRPNHSLESMPLRAIRLLCRASAGKRGSDAHRRLYRHAVFPAGERGRPKRLRIGGMASSKGSNAGPSCSLAAVTLIASGSPWRSTPRGAWCPLCPGRSGCGTGERAAPFGRYATAIQAGTAPVDLAEPTEQLVVDALPQARGLPVPEPSSAGHARTTAQFFGEQFPGDPAAQHKENTGQDLSVRHSGPAAAWSGWLRR